MDTVAAYSDTRPLELPALHDVIDPDALDALFRSREGDGTVVFRYAGYEVTVGSDGEVDLAPVDD